MGDDPHITLRIPSPDEFEMDSFYIPVPSAVIDSGIDVLQGFIVQWKQNEGSAMAHEVWDPLAVAAASALAGLMNAWAAHYHGDQARALVDQIACFCHFGDVVKRESLQGLRDHKGPGHTIFAPQTEHIVDALLALLQESEGRRQERMKERMEDYDRWRKEGVQQRTAPQPEPADPSVEVQKPAGQNDAGWDF